MKIYVVFGHCGEYSDHTRWPVRAYRTEERAQEECIDLIKKAKELTAPKTVTYGGDEFTQYYDRGSEKSDWDPDFRTDYTGTEYDYEEVELIQ